MSLSSMSGNIGRFTLLLTAAATLAFAGAARAEDGVTADSIKIGMVNPLTGAAKGLGTELKTGSEVYLNKMNASGGVNGRKLQIISYDDQYDPKQTAEMTKKLIEDDKVFALFDFVGTPTGMAAVPHLSRSHVPLVGMFTGAEAFRQPVNPDIFHIRASYWDETEEMVKHLVDDLGIKDIAAFSQDDAFGQAVKSGVQRALIKRGLKLAGAASFARASTDVEKGIDELMKTNPKAVILSGAYVSCSAIMKKAHAKGFHPVFLNVSFVGTHDLIQDAGADAEGSYITQVVPSYTDSSYGVVRSYEADMKAAGKEPGFGSLEGYLNAMVLVHALRDAGKDLTRDSFRKALNGMTKVDLGGLTISYDPSSHVGLHQVFLTEVKGGKPMPVTKMTR